MPWKNQMNERMQFVMRLESGERMSALCREFNISRKTGYKFLNRWQEYGREGLFDRSKRPYRSPNRTPRDLEALVIESRFRHPTWGPKKLHWELEREHPGLPLPGVSTMAVILRREGLVHGRKRPRRRASPTLGPLREATSPNAVWCIDFKGQFKTGKRYCYPLTVSDQHTRYLLGCEALEGTQGQPVMDALASVFRLYGVPEAMRSDNGSPFASTGRHGLSKVGVWLMRQNIHLERIEPGHPEQNGRHERMHRTLKQETARPAKCNILAQQERFDAFRDEYNNNRPHEGLGMKTPADVYQPSLRAYVERPKPLEYPLHDFSVVVNNEGKARIKPAKKSVYIGTAFAGQRIGLRGLDKDCWLAHFMTTELGLVDGKLHTLIAVPAEKTQHWTPNSED